MNAAAPSFTGLSLSTKKISGLKEIIISRKIEGHCTLLKFSVKW
jgi:hypothetical protein